MVEFLLVAPVLLAISGGTIEVANFMRLSQISTVASQEMANVAYRRCASITRVENPNSPNYQPASNSLTDGTIKIQLDNTTTATEIQNCLVAVQTETLTELLSLNSGSTTGNSAQLIVARFNPDSSFQSIKAVDPPASIPIIPKATPAKLNNGYPGSNGKKDEHSAQEPVAASRLNSGGNDSMSGTTKTNDKSSPNKIKDLPCWRDQLAESGRNILFNANGGSTVLISQTQLQNRQQVIVGQVVAQYTPLIKFFNLSIIHSGEFRATTLL